MKALRGYHNKVKGEHGIYTNYPIIVDPQFEPFLVTESDIFVVQHPRLLQFVQNYKARIAFNRVKQKVALILAAFGLVPIVYTILLAFGFIAEPIPVLHKFMNLVFWLAILGLIVFWHDHYTKHEIKDRLPVYDDIPETDLEKYQKQAVPFSSLVARKPMDYLTPQFREVLFDALKVKESEMICSSTELLKNLLAKKEIKQLIKRLEMKMPANLESYGLTNESLPDYPVFAVHSFIFHALEQAVITRSPYVYPEHLFLALVKIFPALTNFFKDQEVDATLIQKVVEWKVIEEEYQGSLNPFNLKVPYIPKGGMADSWVYGFTFYLDKVSKDITRQISTAGGLYGIGHEAEVQSLLGTIQRDVTANALLVGEAGTGKTSIVWGLAQRILVGDVPPNLKNKRILQLNINQIINYGNQLGGIPVLIEHIASEMKNAGNIILFIDEFHELVIPQEKGGASIGDYLLPYLIESNAPVIGTINYKEYHDYVQDKSSLQDAFSMIEVKEVTPDDTLTILTTKLKKYEQEFSLFISFKALHAIVALTQKFMPAQKLPKKAVLVLDQACVAAQNKNLKVIDPGLIKEVISVQTTIPVADVDTKEADRLLNLAENIHKKYVDQEEAVASLVEALQRARTGIRDIKKPIGVYLFLGPTGVGKTYLSQILGKEYFGHKHQMVRIDMSQFKAVNTIPELINRLDKVRTNPFTILLLDELEKAAKPIFDIFLRIFDEGSWQNDNGQTISFTNTIIIATSNIGSSILLKDLAGQEETAEKVAPPPTIDMSRFDQSKQKVMEEVHKNLRPELINRFDRILIFKPLSEPNLIKIAELLLTELEVRLDEQNIKAIWTPDLARKVALEGYSPGMGARPIKRYIQDTIEPAIAKYILEYQQENEGRKPKEVTL